MTAPKPQKDPIDPRGLMTDAYAIDGISEPECRSIFLDWAIGVPAGEDVRDHIATLLDRHGSAADHPMTHVLRAGLEAVPGEGER